jgi:hypothetical protein
MYTYFYLLIYWIGDLVSKLNNCREGMKKYYCSLSGEVEDAIGLHIFFNLRGGTGTIGQ